METQIAFDPRLGVNATEFAAQWQQTPENHAIAQISVANPSSTQTFGEPATLITLSTIALGVATNAIWDAIKSTYHRLCASNNHQAKPIEIQQIKYPDGTEITIVRLKD